MPTSLPFFYPRHFPTYALCLITLQKRREGFPCLPYLLPASGDAYLARRLPLPSLYPEGRARAITGRTYRRLPCQNLRPSMATTCILKKKASEKKVTFYFAFAGRKRTGRKTCRRLYTVPYLPLPPYLPSFITTVIYPAEGGRLLTYTCMCCSRDLCIVVCAFLCNTVPSPYTRFRSPHCPHADNT